MLQYLINMSAVWLIGLLVFDLLLQKETYHTYNRVYLSAVLLMGVFLPLWSWQESSVIFTFDYTEPIIEQSAIVRQSIPSATESVTFGWEQWLWVVYIMGVAVVTFRLLREVYQLYTIYKSSSKERLSGYTMAETNRHTAPFSIFNIIFISSKENYSGEELSIIIGHELRHSKLLHIIDVLIVRVLQILFWFNPLIYLFEKRVLMVHEYQADSIMNGSPKTYGQFLLEQSSLNLAPALSHSFIRSPLKKRIVMLTKRSKKIAQIKQLIIAPIILVTLLCCTNKAFSGDEKKVDGNKITYNGNVFEVAVLRPDTVMVEDPATGEIQMRIISRNIPAPVIKVNGDAAYNASEMPPVTATKLINKIKLNISNAISDDLQKLPEGSFSYDIRNLVIDKKGKIIYYEINDMANAFDLRSKEDYTMPNSIQDNIQNKIKEALEDADPEVLSIGNEPTYYVLVVQDYFNILK